MDKDTNRVSVTGKMVLIGVGFGLLYWIIESAVEVFVFHHKGDFFYHLFPPVFHIIWHRLIIVSLLIIFSVYFESIITKHKRVEEELKKYSKELEHSNKLKDLFTDIIRHDLLNPAGVTQEMAEMALKDEKDPDKREHLQLILSGNERVIDIIENATILAKIESGEKLEFKEDDLNTIIRKSVEEMAPLADEKNVKIRVTATGKFPALVNPLIQVVFSNLISNAIKHGPENSDVVAIIKDDGANWKLSVADNGEGIPDEDKETIFDRFKRREKKGVKGTGLGLTIVKRVVEAHKGKVWVEDNPGGGSVFFVTIPKSKHSTNRRRDDKEVIVLKEQEVE